MTTLGLLASWAAALFGAWAFIAGLAATPSASATAPSAIERSSRRALAAAGVAAAIATGVLLSLLLAGDFTVSYVARSVASNLPTAGRIAALFQLAAGAVLPTAALAAAAGLLATRASRAALGPAVAGSVVMALMAASLAAAPFATLPWVPTDGLGLAPALQQPLSLVGHGALSVGLAAATALVAIAADRLAQATDPFETAHGEGAAALAIAATATAMWALGRGAFSAGVTDSPVPPAALNGGLVPALVATLFAWRARAASSAAMLAAALGALGLLAAALLGASRRDGGGVALVAFTAVSLTAAAVGAASALHRERNVWSRWCQAFAVLLSALGSAAMLWLAGGRLHWMPPTAQWALAAALSLSGVASVTSDASGHGAGRWIVLLLAAGGAAAGLWLGPPEAPTLGWGIALGALLGVVMVRAMATAPTRARLSHALLALAAAFAGLGALGEESGRRTRESLAGGARLTVAMRVGPPVTLAHQGVSRYQDGNAHVVAVALEPTRDGRARTLLSAERREFVDGRDEILGPPTSPPAILTLPLEELRVTVDDVAASEAVTLRLTAVAFALAWPAAVVLLALAVLVSFLPRVGRSSSDRTSETVSA